MSPHRTLRNASLVALIVVPSLLLAQFRGTVPPPAEFKTGFDAITTDLANEYLKVIAGPQAAGRGTGQPGYQFAADYVASKYKEMGLVPIGDNGTYFQGVPFNRTGVDAAASSFTAPGVNAKVGSGLGFQGQLGDAEATAKSIVFLNLKDGNTPLPEGLDLTGKAVVATFETVDNRARFMFNNRGPAVVVYVVDKSVAPEYAISRGGTGGGSRPGGNQRPRVPMVTLDRKIAIDMARAAGVDATVCIGSNPNNTAVMKEATGDVAVTIKVKTEAISVPNVIGMLPGSDPELGKEYIGVGAHLDHNGVMNGVVYPGADDDGSGSTALLLVAKALTTNPLKPKRSVVFMAFCGEEMGLIGSAYYANNPIIPLDRMTCLLQMDMVGRNEEQGGQNPDKPEDNVNTIHLVGSKRISMQLHDITLEMNRHTGFVFEYDEEDVYTRSDHYNFAAKGVPITFLFSGFHPDYHRPTDTIDKINFEKIVNAARLNYMVISKVGFMPDKLKHDAVGG